MTKKEQVKELITLLNKATGSPTEPYQADRNHNGFLIPNDGAFLLDGENYRYRVDRMHASGGTSAPFGYERYTIGKLVPMIHRILDGVQLGKVTERKLIDDLASSEGYGNE